MKGEKYHLIATELLADCIGPAAALGYQDAGVDSKNCEAFVDLSGEEAVVGIFAEEAVRALFAGVSKPWPLSRRMIIASDVMGYLIASWTEYVEIRRDNKWKSPPDKQESWIRRVLISL